MLELPIQYSLFPILHRYWGKEIPPHTQTPDSTALIFHPTTTPAHTAHFELLRRHHLMYCDYSAQLGTECCDERFCGVFVYVREHTSGTMRPTFTIFSMHVAVAVARSSFGNVAILYVLPVSRMTS